MDMKKLILFCLIALLLISSVTYAASPKFENSQQSFSEGLAFVKLDGKWGAVDPAGQWVIKPTFSDDNGFDFLKKIEMLGFSEGFQAIRIGDKWGYIDKTGTLVIQPQFQFASKFSQGLAAVKIDGRWGYIDTTGKIVIPITYHFCGPFKEDLAMVMVDKGTKVGIDIFMGWTGRKQRSWGFIDKTGQVVIPLQYGDYDDDLNNTDELHLLWAKSGYADEYSHKTVQEGSFSNGFALVRLKDKVIYINKQGQNAFPNLKGLPYSHFEQGYGCFYDEKDRARVIDTNGNITPSQYDYKVVGPFENGLAYAAVQFPGKMGFIDTSGKFIIPPIYEFVSSFSEGLACVKQDGKWGFIDMAGKVVIPLQYDDWSFFKDGLAWVKINGKYAVIDKTGTILY